MVLIKSGFGFGFGSSQKIRFGFGFGSVLDPGFGFGSGSGSVPNPGSTYNKEVLLLLTQSRMLEVVNHLESHEEGKDAPDKNILTSSEAFVNMGKGVTPITPKPSENNLSITNSYN